MFPLFFVFSLLHFFKCRRYVFHSVAIDDVVFLRGFVAFDCQGMSMEQTSHWANIHFDYTCLLFSVTMIPRKRFGWTWLHTLQLLGKQRWLSTRWAFRRYGFGESVNVTDQSCLRGCGLKVVASKRILFWNTAGFWPLRDFGVNHLESILQGWLTCRSQRAQHSGSVYGIFIPLALLHLFLRQHLLMRSCRSVAAVTQVGHNGNLTVPWCTSLIHAGIASNC